MLAVCGKTCPSKIIRSATTNKVFFYTTNKVHNERKKLSSLVIVTREYMPVSNVILIERIVFEALSARTIYLPWSNEVTQVIRM